MRWDFVCICLAVFLIAEEGNLCAGQRRRQFEDERVFFEDDDPPRSFPSPSGDWNTIPGGRPGRPNQNPWGPPGGDDGPWNPPGGGNGQWNRPPGGRPNPANRPGNDLTDPFVPSDDFQRPPVRPTRRPQVDRTQPPRPGSSRPSSTTTTPRTTTPSAAERDCTGRCVNSPEYNPVCGSDNVTYSNPSRLRCAESCGKRVNINHYGVCRATGPPLPFPRRDP